MQQGCKKSIGARDYLIRKQSTRPMDRSDEVKRSDLHEKVLKTETWRRHSCLPRRHSCRRVRPRLPAPPAEPHSGDWRQARARSRSTPRSAVGNSSRGLKPTVLRQSLQPAHMDLPGGAQLRGFAHRAPAASETARPAGHPAISWRAASRRQPLRKSRDCRPSTLPLRSTASRGCSTGNRTKERSMQMRICGSNRRKCQ